MQPQRHKYKHTHTKLTTWPTYTRPHKCMHYCILTHSHAHGRISLLMSDLHNNIDHCI